MKVTHRQQLLLAVVLAIGAVAIFIAPDARAREKQDDPAVERARKQVRMLDDLYKTAIVLITTNYVEEDTDLAAGDAFQALFKVMKDKGWHEVRLLDATGEPYDEDNAPRDEFEKQAVKKIKGGESYVDEVVTKDGKPYLRAATAVPVVLEKCVMCHSHYADVPEGQAIGALGYIVPIE
ncbi:MAG: DUF3365 domain-containing protein [Planctomycetaceae bacterium]|nr:DUF3365 domain-containing protein [Planctomycetaceae bacterium]